jgi:Mrr restriction endonuclease-like protein
MGTTEMPTIELSQETFDRLKELAEPLVDTPDTVVQKLLEAYAGGGDRVTAPKAQKGANLSALKIVTRDRKRARKGEKTPIEEFYAPLVRVLKEAGGKLPANEAIERVGQLMAQSLNEVDRSRLPSGEVRWRNTVRWASQRLQKDGKLDKKNTWGIWKLAS